MKVRGVLACEGNIALIEPFEANRSDAGPCGHNLSRNKREREREREGGFASDASGLSKSPKTEKPEQIYAPENEPDAF